MSDILKLLQDLVSRAGQQAVDTGNSIGSTIEEGAGKFMDDASSIGSSVGGAFEALMGQISSPQKASSAHDDIGTIFRGQDPRPSRSRLQELEGRSGSGTLSFVSGSGEESQSESSNSSRGQFSRMGADATGNFVANYGVLHRANSNDQAAKMDQLFTSTAADIAQAGGSQAEIARKLLTLAKITGKPSSAVTSILAQVDAEGATQDQLRTLIQEAMTSRKPGESSQDILARVVQKYSTGEY